ncbi:prespore-specific transcription regulator RsfA [Salinibacillus aidingensis]|uniref:Prespore-specific transcription regulator RsfA n=1 Tax=Salinibacillus aidingensis TaxID=237684 RepID=A0ABP3KR21_9BACI
MAKVRQDAWSHEDDLLLAETVLRHIREGSTQLNAFEEVGDQLNRTAAACGFRWNAEVRRRYEKAIEIAKRQRKERKRAIAQQQKLQQQTQSPSVPAYQPAAGTVPAQQDLQPQQSETTAQPEPMEQKQQTQSIANQQSVPSIDDIIVSLQEFKSNFEHNYQKHANIDQLQQENETLRAENEELEKRLKKVEKEYESMQEDYQVLMSIMDKARKMVVFDDDAEPSQAFRMDKNGNLEQVAR